MGEREAVLAVVTRWREYNIAKEYICKSSKKQQKTHGIQAGNLGVKLTLIVTQYIFNSVQ